MNKLQKIITDTLDSKKAQDIVVVDFDKTNSLCDAFIIADAPSIRQINAIADALEYTLKQEGFAIRNVERQSNSTWILIDVSDIVIHLFLTEDRSHYNLESLYREYIKHD